MCLNAKMHHRGYSMYVLERRATRATTRIDRVIYVYGRGTDTRYARDQTHTRAGAAMVLAALFRLQSSSCETEYNFVCNCMYISMSY
eukprot:COSAG02_NODE_6665_length_3436_cov_157.242497_6_plen_87_part_00